MSIYVKQIESEIFTTPVSMGINNPMFRAERLRQKWDSDLDWYWNDNSAFKTHFLNALSITLPACERFFIDTVKPYLKSANPELKPELIEFIRQEGNHSYAHTHYNDWLEEGGLQVSHLQKTSNKKWRWVRRHLSLKNRLAITICVEHITVCYAAVFLSQPEILDKMSPHFRSLWQYHAVEEIEHKSVTMNLWNQIGGGEWLKRIAMLLVLPTYMWVVGSTTLVFLHRDGQLWRWQTWSDMVHFLFNRSNGVVRRSFLPWLDLFRRDFHPDDHDHQSLLTISKFG